MDLKTAIEGLNIDSFVEDLHKEYRVITPHFALRRLLEHLHWEVYGERWYYDDFEFLKACMNHHKPTPRR
jgi:hypothetical protein